jgi:23S rRNA U2552 (ribose-2'-O)-methylase RlmE/FtsJ
MIVYHLEKTSHRIPPEQIELKFKEMNNSNIFISQSLYHYLSESKKKIDNNVNEWDYFKKFTNPYEYIHTPPQNSVRSVADYVAISRSFYKMIEIINYFDLLNDFDKNALTSFHVAEGPGGFIEAMMYLRKGKGDVYHGMTLQSESKNIPKWNKLQNKFKFSQNIKYEKGPKNNGNLFEPENFEYCVKTYGNSMNFMTGDGGFDFSIDYDKQELSATKLIYAQIIYALMMQKENGHFVLKIFDIFHKSSLELIYLLNCFYKNVCVCKPKTSRFANSEKYLICKNFIFKDTSQFYVPFLQGLTLCNSPQSNTKSIISIFNFLLPRFFIQEIEEMNSIFGKKQLSTIHTTLLMIKEHRNDKVERFKKSHIEKCIQWCSKNNILYNSSFKGENIFTRHLNTKS